MAVEHDEIGIWSEVKFAIIKKYAAAYTTVMEAQRRERISRLRWLYIDGYAGSGHHVSKTSGDLVEGSPLIALNTNPAFHEYHFIDTPWIANFVTRDVPLFRDGYLELTDAPGFGIELDRELCRKYRVAGDLPID